MTDSENPRNIVASFQRRREEYRKIAYSSIDNAIPRITYHLMVNAKVGDIVEVSHRITGKQLGTVKLTSTGRIVSDWEWEKPFKWEGT